MEKHEILSMKNCHRAATVQQIANPEYGVWKFEWRGQKLGGNAFYTEYAHIASKPCFGNATVISDMEIRNQHGGTLGGRTQGIFRNEFRPRKTCGAIYPGI